MKKTRKKALIVLLVILALVPLLYSAVEAYSTSVPVMDYFPKAHWEHVRGCNVIAAGMLPQGYLPEPRSGFIIWYETADMKNYAPPVLRRIGFHVDTWQELEPKKLQEVLGKHRFWYVDNEFHEPEYLFIISSHSRMWWLGASKGEYIILLPRNQPRGQEKILHFRDNGGLYFELMRLFYNVK